MPSTSVSGTRIRWPRWSLLVYALLAVLLFSGYRYWLNPDTVSYLSLARQYALGNFASAINGYWSPLYAWLMVPLLRLGIDPLAAPKLVLLLSGAALLVAMATLSERLSIPARMGRFVPPIAVPFVLCAALLDNTPDLLVATLLCWYLVALTSQDYLSSPKPALLAGAWGALAYFAKNYALGFFLVHFLLVHAGLYFYQSEQKGRRRALLSFALGFSVFLLLAGIWMGLLWHHYGTFTIGRAGKYLQYACGPTTNADMSMSYDPMHMLGLLAPPNADAVSAWDDPTCYKFGVPWSPFDSWAALRHAIKMTLYNLQSLTRCSMNGSWFSPTILWCYLFLAVPFSRSFWTSRPFHLLITVAIWGGGFLLVTSNIMDRFLWFNLVLILLAGVDLVSRLEVECASSFKRTLALILLALSFALQPAVSLYHYRHYGRDVYMLAQSLRDQYHLAGNVAAAPSADRSSWYSSVHLSYLLGLRFYGTALSDCDAPHLMRALADHHIDYYLVWKGAVLPENFSDHFDEITNGSIPALKVYRIARQPPAPSSTTGPPGSEKRYWFSE